MERPARIASVCRRSFAVFHFAVFAEFESKCRRLIRISCKRQRAPRGARQRMLFCTRRVLVHKDMCACTRSTCRMHMHAIYRTNKTASTQTGEEKILLFVFAAYNFANIHINDMSRAQPLVLRQLTLIR